MSWQLSTAACEQRFLVCGGAGAATEEVSFEATFDPTYATGRQLAALSGAEATYRIIQGRLWKTECVWRWSATTRTSHEAALTVDA